MRVLLLGGTGNLGSRLIPALVVHGHTVTAYVRSEQKLKKLVSPDLIAQITIEVGDAFDTPAVAEALRKHDCNAIINAAGNHEPVYKEQTLPKLVRSVTQAARTVGAERGQPLRAWITGAMTSLRYPGTSYKIRDYMPTRLMEHMNGTEAAVTAIPVEELCWSLLCVAWMYPASEEIVPLAQPRGHSLAVQATTPPAWEDHWIRQVPLIGTYLNLVPVIVSYATMLEDVADMVAEDVGRDETPFIGSFVGFKDVGAKKAD